MQYNLVAATNVFAIELWKDMGFEIIGTLPKAFNHKTEGLMDAPHEEALRDVLLAQPSVFACEDVSGLPWLEVDFPEDVERAIKHILPAIRKDLADF